MREGRERRSGFQGLQRDQKCPDKLSSEHLGVLLLSLKDKFTVYFYTFLRTFCDEDLKVLLCHIRELVFGEYVSRYIFLSLKRFLLKFTINPWPSHFFSLSRVFV